MKYKNYYCFEVEFLFFYLNLINEKYSECFIFKSSSATFKKEIVILAQIIQK